MSTLIGSGILVQRVRCVALVGADGALNGDVVEEDFVGHGTRESQISVVYGATAMVISRFLGLQTMIPRASDPWMKRYAVGLLLSNLLYGVSTRGRVAITAPGTETRTSLRKKPITPSFSPSARLDRDSVLVLRSTSFSTRYVPMTRVSYGS